jgi:hypothetical protein
MAGLFRRLLGPSAKSARSDAAQATKPRTVRQPRVCGSYDTLEVVGESAHQDTLWALSGARYGSRVHTVIVAVLEPEPTNQYDPHAVEVLIHDMPVGYLSREDAKAYLPGLLNLIKTSATGCVGLHGAIAGGGMRDERQAFLGVFLNHDPSDFGVQLTARRSALGSAPRTLATGPRSNSPDSTRSRRKQDDAVHGPNGRDEPGSGRFSAGAS